MTNDNDVLEGQNNDDNVPMVAVVTKEYNNSNINNNNNENNSNEHKSNNMNDTNEQEQNMNNSNSNMMCLYKLHVIYDGTRFHGFQRQIDNHNMNEQYLHKQHEFHKNITKRYQYNDHTGEKIKQTKSGCTISIQECIEMSLLDIFNNNNDSTTKKRKINNNSKKNDNVQQQEVGVVENSLSLLQLSVDDICLRFAGRTDRGVHANGQIVTIYLPTDDAIISDIQRQQQQQYLLMLRKSINSRLPIDISIKSIHIIPKNKEFDPRRSAKLKQYTYTIKYRRRIRNNTITSSSDNIIAINDDDNGSEMNNSDNDNGGGIHTIRNALHDGSCLWVCPWSLNDNCITQLCIQLQGYHNYTNFIHKHERRKNIPNFLTINKIEFHILSETIDDNYSNSYIVKSQFVLEACSFRRTMVRNIVGYCIDVCRGAMPLLQPLAAQLEDNATTSLVGIPQQQNDDSMNHNDTNKDSNILWIPNEVFASNIHAAPACGLCLESVLY